MVRAARSVSVVRILEKTFDLQNHSGDGAFCALPVSGMAALIAAHFCGAIRCCAPDKLICAPNKADSCQKNPHRAFQPIVDVTARHPEGIGGSVYLPVALPQRLAELFGIVLEIAGEIDDPFEQAFFLMVHLPYLQPFEDVNKRVSRLAANFPLVRHNLCPLSFIDVPAQAYVDAMLGVYELNDVALLRDVFVWAYERSCQQYVAVQQQLVPPDTFRLRYRNELAAAVAAIVRGGQAPTKQRSAPCCRQRWPRRTGDVS